MNRYQSATYAEKTNQELRDLHDYYMGVSRAAKNDAQRVRADARCAEVAGEMRRRAAKAGALEEAAA